MNNIDDTRTTCLYHWNSTNKTFSKIEADEKEKSGEWFDRYDKAWLYKYTKKQRWWDPKEAASLIHGYDPYKELPEDAKKTQEIIERAIKSGDLREENGLIRGVNCIRYCKNKKNIAISPELLKTIKVNKETIFEKFEYWFKFHRLKMGLAVLAATILPIAGITTILINIKNWLS